MGSQSPGHWEHSKSPFVSRAPRDRPEWIRSAILLRIAYLECPEAIFWEIFQIYTLGGLYKISDFSNFDLHIMNFGITYGRASYY